MAKVRSLTVMLAAVLLTASTVAVGASDGRSEAATSDRSIKHVDVGDLNLRFVRYSGDARSALVYTGTETQHVDLDSGTATPLTIEPAWLASGDYVYGTAGQSITRETLSTGAVDTFPLSDEVARQLTRVDAATTDGRFVLARLVTNVAMEGETRHAVYDTTLMSFVTSTVTGIDPLGRNTDLVIMSDDGDQFTYQAFTSQFDFEWAMVTRSTDRFVSLQHPAGAVRYSMRASPDLTWLVYQSSDEALFGSGSPVTALYRQHVPTGSIVRVGIGGFTSTVGQYSVLDDGRVLASVLSHEQNITDLQLFVWSNSEPESLQISQPIAGAAADGPLDLDISNVAVDGRGTRFAFSSLASNLVPGTTGNERRMYVATLPPVDPADPVPVRPPRVRTVITDIQLPELIGDAVRLSPALPAPLGNVTFGLPRRAGVTSVTPYGSERLHLDLGSGQLTELRGPAAVVSHVAAVGHRNGSLYREELATGTITRYSPELPEAASEYGRPGPWTIKHVVAIDDAGRFIVFHAGFEYRERTFVFDTEAGALAPWSVDGIVPADAGVPLRSTSAFRLTADQQSVLVGDGDGRILKIDLETGSTRSFEPSVILGRLLAFSDDLQWETYWLFDGQHRSLVRRNTVTGAMDFLPESGGFRENVSIHADGRVIFTAGRGGDDPLPNRVFIWAAGDDHAVEAPQPAGGLNGEQVTRYSYDDHTGLLAYQTFPSPRSPDVPAESSTFLVRIAPGSPLCDCGPVDPDPEPDADQIGGPASGDLEPARRL